MPPFRLTIRTAALCGNGVNTLCRKGAHVSRRPSLPAFIKQRRFERLLWILALVAVVGIAMAEAAPMTNSTETVRIAARKLDNGSVEFALQAWEDDGGIAQWGERFLPRSRFFPANAEVGRWLASTPIEVQTEFNIFGCYESATDFLSCHDMEELSDLTRLEWDTQGVSSEEYYIQYFTGICVPLHAGELRTGGDGGGGPGSGVITPHYRGWTLRDFTRIAPTNYQ